MTLAWIVGAFVSRLFGGKALFAYLAISAVVALSGCTTVKVVAMSPDWNQSVRNGELTWNYPKGKLVDHGPSWVSMPGEQWRCER